jgi:hypothetical protein
VSIEARDVVSEVFLAQDYPRVGLELPHESLFLSYSMKIEKGFGACVAIPEPVGGAEVAVSLHEGLEFFR